MLGDFQNTLYYNLHHSVVTRQRSHHEKSGFAKLNPTLFFVRNVRFSGGGLYGKKQ